MIPHVLLSYALNIYLTHIALCFHVLLSLNTYVSECASKRLWLPAIYFWSSGAPSAISNCGSSCGRPGGMTGTPPGGCTTKPPPPGGGITTGGMGGKTGCGDPS